MVNSLDARAFSAPGGLGSGLGDVLKAIAGGYLQNQDRADARQNQMTELAARLAYDQSNRDEDRAWRQAEAERSQRNQDRQFNAAQDERQRLNDRQGLADALTMAEKYGVVPERPDLVTAPTDQERMVWSAAQHGKDAQGLSAAMEQAKLNLIKSQAAEAQAKAGASKITGGGKGPTSAVLKAVHSLAEANAVASGVAEYNVSGRLEIKDPAAWRDILTQSYRAHGVETPDVTTSEPELDAGVSSGISEALKRYYDGGWFGAGKGDAEPLRRYDPAAVAQVARKQGLAVPSLGSAAVPVARPTLAMPASAPVLEAPTTAAAPPANYSQMVQPVAPVAAPVPAAPATAPPAANPRAIALQTIDQEREALAGMGIDHRLLLSPDLNQRRAVLARMPIDARRRAIDALRIIDSTATR